MSKKQQHAELAHWLQEARNAERETNAAREEAAKWLERAKLAHRSGAVELVEQASTRAREERARFETAKARRDEATNEQSKLRARGPEIGVREARYADELLAVFQDMGIDPTTNELDKLVEQEALQAKMAAIQRAAGIEVQSDPLELLRQRMAVERGAEDAVELGAEDAYIDGAEVSDSEAADSDLDAISKAEAPDPQHASPVTPPATGDAPEA